LTLNGLHGVISQKLILFITTAVKASNPTMFILFSKKLEREGEVLDCGMGNQR
jgi:hypothetical protein